MLAHGILALLLTVVPDAPEVVAPVAEARAGIGALWPRVGDGYWITGASTPLAASLGLNVTGQLSAFVELSDLHMFGPAANDQAQRLHSLDVYGAGLGAKLYLTPRGFFVSGAALLARLQYEGLTETGFALSETSHWGVLGRLTAGREWLVSPSWSIGAAGEVQLGTMKTSASFYNNNYGSDAFTLKGLALLGLATFSPSGTPGVAEPEAHIHEGFYANVSLGPGWLGVNTRREDELYAAPDDRYSGVGSRLSGSLGYSFANELVAFVQVTGLRVHQPTSRVNPGVGAFEPATLSWYGAGPGLRYDLSPSNWFLAGSVLMSRVALANGMPDDSRYGVHRSSGWGLTGQISGGKEWWVSRHLGIGAAAEFGLGRMAGADIWRPYTVKTISILASVTYD